MLEIDKSKSTLLLNIAKEAILENLDGQPHINKQKLLQEHPWLNIKGALFVTINKRGTLRGCIGSIIAHQSILDDLIKNAKAAAFNDPRFPPLSKEELDEIEIEISILTPPKELHYTNIEDLKSKIKKGQDGVILNYNGYQATYLPSVWEDLNSFELFFATLCQKAGLQSNCLELHPTIYTYNAIKISNKN